LKVRYDGADNKNKFFLTLLMLHFSGQGLLETD
jgi:hypothetical protein